MSIIDQFKLSHKGLNIVVDTNLLILLFVGSFDASWIGKFKRTAEFVVEDFLLLQNFLKDYKIITTPNILTELTNLCDSLNSKTSYDFYKYISNLITSDNEIYVDSSEVFKEMSFIKYGLTDSVIEYLANRDLVVLTDDLPLYGFLFNKSLKVINFNHIRSDYYLN